MRPPVARVKTPSLTRVPRWPPARLAYSRWSMRRPQALFLVLAAACSSRADSSSSPGFAKHTLDTAFRAEGVAVFDVDRDGHVDLVTDQEWYAGPNFDAGHEIRAPDTYDPAARWSLCSAAFRDDVDGARWTDP